MTSNAIHLQGIGSRPAVALSEIQVGDTLMWNYGTQSMVTALRAVGKNTIEVTTTSRDGETTFRKRATTPVVRVSAKAERCTCTAKACFASCPICGRTSYEGYCPAEPA
jgi:hypothetical protein